MAIRNEKIIPLDLYYINNLGVECVYIIFTDTFKYVNLQTRVTIYLMANNIYIITFGRILVVLAMNYYDEHTSIV